MPMRAMLLIGILAGVAPMVAGEDSQLSADVMKEAQAVAIAWVDALNARNFTAYADLLADKFTCVVQSRDQDRILSRKRCLKRTRRKFRPGTHIELVEGEVLDLGSRPSSRTVHKVDVDKSPHGVKVSFQYDLSREDVSEFGKCELVLVSSDQGLRILTETQTIIEIERLAPERPLKSDCKAPPGNPRHCVVLETFQHDLKSLQALVARLKREGFEAELDSEEQEPSISLTLTAEHLKKLFLGRYVYRRVERSARRGTICNAYLADIHIPRRYRQSIKAAFVGHQICE